MTSSSSSSYYQLNTFQIDKFLNNSNYSNQIILCHGSRQCGKTTLINDWITQLKQSNHDIKNTHIIDNIHTYKYYDFDSYKNSIIWFKNYNQSSRYLNDIQKCIQDCKQNLNYIFISCEYLGDLSRKEIRLQADIIITFHTKIMAIRKALYTDWYGYDTSTISKHDNNWETLMPNNLEHLESLFYNYLNENTQKYSTLITCTRIQSYNISDFTFQYKTMIKD